MEVEGHDYPDNWKKPDDWSLDILLIKLLRESTWLELERVSKETNYARASVLLLALNYVDVSGGWAIIEKSLKDADFHEALGELEEMLQSNEGTD